MTYDLNAEIREILDTTSLSDPGEIADRVAESIPSRNLRDVLRVTLRSHVRTVVRYRRADNAAHTDQSGSGHTSDETQKIAAAAGPTPKAKVARSWKRDSIAPAWQAHLNDRYFGVSQWKRLADMTYDDLIAEAERRESLASQNAAQGAKFRTWAGLVKDSGVSTFGELPGDTQEQELAA